MKSRPVGTAKRLRRLRKRVDREAAVFPKKHDHPLNRLVKIAKKPKPKSATQQIKEWEEFTEKTR